MHERTLQIAIFSINVNIIAIVLRNTMLCSMKRIFHAPTYTYLDSICPFIKNMVSVQRLY